MFPLSHTYVSTRVTGRSGPLLVFGSVLPDIATTSKNNIGRDKIHYSPNEFREFIEKNYPAMSELGVGIDLHSHINQGADFYSDNSEVGFAYLYGKKIVDRVKKLLRTDDEAVSLVLAHNLIEAGVDINLKASNPEIYKIYSDSFSNLDIEGVCKCLADYLELSVEAVKLEIDNFINFLGPASLVSVETTVERTASPLVSMRFGIDVDKKDLISIINSAVEITRDIHRSLLDHAVTEIIALRKIKF